MADGVCLRPRVKVRVKVGVKVRVKEVWLVFMAKG